MEKKKYSSYAQIELELEILKVERELNLQRVIWNVHKIREDLSPMNIIKGYLGDYKSILSTLSNYSGMIGNIVIPLLINWITKRKRGN